MDPRLNREIVEFLAKQRARDTLDYPVYPAPPPMAERVRDLPISAEPRMVTEGERRCLMGQCCPQDHPHGDPCTWKHQPTRRVTATEILSGPSEPASALWRDDPLGQPGDGVGKKQDAGKVQMTRLGMVSRALADVARVQEYGSKKYPSPDNWKHVPEGSKRYRDAALRHLMADLSGESHDPETGLTHAAHAACNLLIAAEHDMGFPEINSRPLAPVPEGATRPHWRF